MKIIFHLKAKIESTGDMKEFIYVPYFVNDKKEVYHLNSCYYNAYAKTAKEAKEIIKTQSNFCQVIDNLIDGTIIKCPENGCFPSASLLTNYEIIRHGIFLK